MSGLLETVAAGVQRREDGALVALRQNPEDDISPLAKAVAVFSLACGSLESDMPEEIARKFFGKRPLPPLPSNPEARRALATRQRDRLMPKLLPMLLTFYPDLRFMLIVGARTLPLDFNGPLSMDEAVIVRNLVDLIKLFIQIFVVSDATSRRILNDFTLIETLLLFVETGLFPMVVPPSDPDRKRLYRALFIISVDAAHHAMRANVSGSVKVLDGAYPEINERIKVSTPGRLWSVFRWVYYAKDKFYTKNDDHKVKEAIFTALFTVHRLLDGSKHLVDTSNAIPELNDFFKEGRKEFQKFRSNVGTEWDLCDGCGTQSKELKRCSRCLVGRFCTPECQKRTWKHHKVVCFDASFAPIVGHGPRLEAWSRVIPAISR